MNSTPRSAMLALACIAPLSACSSARSGAETAVRDSLKDPDSAKFGDFYLNDKTKKGCLTVNARNSMGGYTGDQQAFVMQIDGRWAAIHMADVSQSLCRQAHADTPEDTPATNSSAAR